MERNHRNISNRNRCKIYKKKITKHNKTKILLNKKKYFD